MAPPKILVQNAVCIKKIATYDYPERWSSLLPGIVTYLQSQTASEVYGALWALRSLVEKYEFKPRDHGREPLMPIVEARRLARKATTTHASVMLNGPNSGAKTEMV